MGIMNIAIVDDELNFRTWIYEYLSSKYPEDHFVCFGDGASFLAVQREFDGVFLDMDLKQEQGYEIAKEITSKELQVCYVTAHEETARFGYCASAIGFVLKDDQLLKQLDYYIQRMKQAQQLLHLHSEDGYMDIPFSKIVYVEVNHKEFHLYLTNRRRLRILNMNLTKFLELCGHQLVKINQSQAIHKHQVKQLQEMSVLLYHYPQPLFISRKERLRVLRELYE